MRQPPWDPPTVGQIVPIGGTKGQMCRSRELQKPRRVLRGVWRQFCWPLAPYRNPQKGISSPVLGFVDLPKGVTGTRRRHFAHPDFDVSVPMSLSVR